MRRALRWQGGDPIMLSMASRDSLLLHRYPQMQALRADVRIRAVPGAGYLLEACP